MSFTKVDGGICAAEGFQAAGVAAGIKASGKPDVTLVVSDHSASVAATFTRSLSAAAPVVLSRQRAGLGHAHGVVINAGCANACTGEQGMRDAEEMSAYAAKVLGFHMDEMLVCSTGLIGSYLPMDKVKAGIDRAASSLSRDASSAIQAIMTTDKKPKSTSLASSEGWKIGGMAKGAGMIAPNMATMLSVITTDAMLDPRELNAFLPEIVDRTFNCITIDGDTSTNDSVILLANGASGVQPDFEEFADGLYSVCASLAEKIVADGEGATKFVRVRVSGAWDEDAARTAARTVAESLLVKTAVHGGDPNWGRIAAALGRSGVPLDLATLSISIAGHLLFDKGVPMGPEAHALAHRAMKDPELTIECDLGGGDSAFQILTTDLSEEYVTFNSDYET